MINHKWQQLLIGYNFKRHLPNQTLEAVWPMSDLISDAWEVAEVGWG